jgi:hypothetical protein
LKRSTKVAFQRLYRTVILPQKPVENDSLAPPPRRSRRANLLDNDFIIGTSELKRTLT